MPACQNLHWDDIESRLFQGKAYIDHLSSKKSIIMHKSNYRASSPDKKIISQIQHFFENKTDEWQILALGASWCKTCAKVKPYQNS
jgi:hypothetical protein